VYSRLDGRSLRKSGRTLQLATRVSAEFDNKLRHIAQRDGLKLVEVLELGLNAYEAIRERRAGELSGQSRAMDGGIPGNSGISGNV